MKKKLWELSMVLTPLSQAFLIFFGFLATGLLPAYWIFVNADTLDYFWVPLQIGHIVLLGAATFYLNRKKQIREIRMYFPDDEQFFELFPGKGVMRCGPSDARRTAMSLNGRRPSECGKKNFPGEVYKFASNLMIKEAVP